MIDLIEAAYRKNKKAYFKLIGNAVQDPEDVIQDAFVKAISLQDSFDQEKSKFDTWFRKILMNCLKSKLQQEQKHGQTFDITDWYMLMVYLGDDVSRADHPVYSLIDEEAPRERVVLRLLVNGHTSKEVAKLFKQRLSEANIRKIKQRFVEKHNGKLLQLRDTPKATRDDRARPTGKALREKVSMDASPDIKSLLLRATPRLPKRNPGPVTWSVEGEEVRIIPVLDNPRAIEKVKDEETKAFLQARRKTLSNLRHPKRGV